MSGFNGIMCIGLFRGVRDLIDTGKTNHWLVSKYTTMSVDVFIDVILRYELNWAETKEEKRWVVNLAAELVPEYSAITNSILECGFPSKNRLIKLSLLV